MPLQITIPAKFGRQQEVVLTAYLTDFRQLDTTAWQQLRDAIDLLGKAYLTVEGTRLTFKQVYDTYIDQAFANQCIDALLASANVQEESKSLIALFARQIAPSLQKVGLLERTVSQSWLLLAYCVYRWQSFARGYAFEVEIMRDLTASGIQFQMHDLRSRIDRYSSADLTILDFSGDLKTSSYFLQAQPSGELPNDFYITRLYEKGHERTVVVFQKPFVWEFLGGEKPVPGVLPRVLSLLPRPVQLKQHSTILVVVEYTIWKQKVLNKQSPSGV